MKRFLAPTLLALYVLSASCSGDDVEAIINDLPVAFDADSPITDLLARASINPTNVPNVIDSYSCFNIQLPVEVSANGQAVTISTQADYAQVEAIFNEVSYDEDNLELNYPITVVMGNYSTQTVNNEGELNALAYTCTGNEDVTACFSINYPIVAEEYDANNDLVAEHTISSDMQLYLMLSALGSNSYAVQYPVSVNGYNGVPITINNHNEFVAAVQNIMADCETYSCNTANSSFLQAYNGVKALNGVTEMFSMDALTHEYTFSMSQAGTICSIGYKAEYRPTAIAYLIEIVDANENVIYSGTHTFASAYMDYVSITPVALEAGAQYSVRRTVESYAVGSGIGTYLQTKGWGENPVLPYTYGNITIYHARFFNGGGSLYPLTHMLPQIDLVFKAN